MTVDPQRLKELFLNAAEIATPAERAAFSGSFFPF